MIRRAQSVIGLIGIVLISIMLNGRTFLDPGNLTDVLREMSIIGIMALAMTFVILTAGIDLSVGSILALATCVLAKVLVPVDAYGVPHPERAHGITLAIVAAVGVAGLAGALNGVLIGKLRVPAFVITLASMIGVRGLAKWLSTNATTDIGFGEADAAARFAEIFGSKPVMIGTFVGLAVIFWVLLRRTVFGRYVRAIGDNEKAALYSGLPIMSVKIAVYTLSGMLAGIAGVLHAARGHQSNPNGGMGYELDVIAAVVIGGTSLSGGRGSIAGTVIGTLIMGVLTNLLGLQNVDDNVKMMIKAVIIILAVWAQRRKSE